MELLACQIYKRSEIKHFFKVCPICNTKEYLTYWSNLSGGANQTGTEGIDCSGCKLELSFMFHTDGQEIIDEYKLDYLKIGRLEFKPDPDNHLAVYLNNIYVKDLPNNIIDLEKYKNYLLVS